MAYDSIVIGSGLSGLTCALLLAARGKKVLVVERHGQPAPVVRGFVRQGLYFDSGFHYVGGLGEGGAFRPLFRHLGLEGRLKLTPLDPDGFDCLRVGHDGEILRLPCGYRRIRAELGQRYPDQAGRLERYFDEIESGWCRYPYLDLDADLSEFAMASVHGESLQSRLQEFAEAPQLQSLLSMHSLLYGVDPGAASTTLNAQVAGSYYHSAHAIDGGGRALVRAYLERLAELGGEIRCRAEVEEIRVANGAVTGVRLSGGEEIRAAEVIATLNPTLVPEMLPQGVLRPAYLKRLKRLRQTMSAYVLYGRIARPSALLRRRNLFVQPGAGIFRAGIGLPLEQRGCYLTAAENNDCGSGIIAVIPAAYDEVDAFSDVTRKRSEAYADEKVRLAARLKTLMTRCCPELEGLEVVDLATPLTLRDYSAAPQGAVYGVGHFIGQYNPHPVTRLPGLYLSGQAVTAPGLLGAVIAAYITCGSIVGHEPLRGEIKSCR